MRVAIFADLSSTVTIVTFSNVISVKKVFDSINLEQLI